MVERVKPVQQAFPQRRVIAASSQNVLLNVLSVVFKVADCEM
jgi:hypothetical protein